MQFVLWNSEQGWAVSMRLCGIKRKQAAIHQHQKRRKNQESVAQSKDYAKQNIVYLRKNEQADLEQMGCKAFI